VSAAHYALARGRVAPRQLARAVVGQLNEAPAAQAAAPPAPPRLRLAA
jgi:hypothetical protein